MTKDYRRPPPAPRRRGARRGTCAFWFLLGGVLGAFGVGYAWMIHEPTASGTINEEATTRPPTTPPQERQFDFFSMLPAEEVVVPADEAAEPIALPPAKPEAPAAAPAVKPTPQPANTAAATPAPSPDASKPAPNATASAAPSGGSGDYLLQLASFRSTDDAERLKAQMALKGIQTSIQTVTIDNGQTYHRVRTTTYDKSAAQAMRAKLQSEGQESIMIRTR
ncbi:SPOR domain-containing protein [Lamprobacter modestohalophilus]|uniref:SPOR domain-containing protein n=1 Tax=Lamprobacter modestohalophilus TaxID=1064514 RepID=UPI002ADEFB28|nr:SPOR domain-containing protein [Lamprobacter modestohalophilus]MEA1049359.1 SPOR domain-containing protein [Lamprobacter modestohalophilus]